MKRLFYLGAAVVVSSWFVMGMDCGARPNDLNLRFLVVDNGASVKLMWDDVEEATHYIVYRDDELMDTLGPDSTEYLVDSTMVGKQFKVVAEGARMEGALDLAPVVDSFVIGEYDNDASVGSGFYFDTDGLCYTLNLKADSSAWPRAQAVLMDDVADSVNPATMQLMSGSASGVNRLHTGFAAITGDYAPTVDTTDSAFAYAETQSASGVFEYAMWIDADNFAWNSTDHFVRLLATNVDYNTGSISVRYAYQTAPGLRWLPW